MPSDPDWDPFLNSNLQNCKVLSKSKIFEGKCGKDLVNYSKDDIFKLLKQKDDSVLKEVGDCIWKQHQTFVNKYNKRPSQISKAPKDTQKEPTRRDTTQPQLPIRKATKKDCELFYQYATDNFVSQNFEQATFYFFQYIINFPEKEKSSQYISDCLTSAYESCCPEWDGFRMFLEEMKKGNYINLDTKWDDVEKMWKDKQFSDFYASQIKDHARCRDYITEEWCAGAYYGDGKVKRTDMYHPFNWKYYDFSEVTTTTIESFGDHNEYFESIIAMILEKEETISNIIQKLKKDKEVFQEFINLNSLETVVFDEDDAVIINRLLKKGRTLEKIAKKVHQSKEVLQAYIDNKKKMDKFTDTKKCFFKTLMNKEMKVNEIIHLLEEKKEAINGKISAKQKPWNIPANITFSLIKNNNFTLPLRFSKSSMLNLSPIFPRCFSQNIICIIFSYIQQSSSQRELHAKLNKSNQKFRDSDLALWILQNKSTETLTDLNFSHNQISDYGAKLLSYFLKDNKTVTSFDLTSNRRITGKGAYTLAKAIFESETIKKFSNLQLQELKLGKQKSNKLGIYSSGLGDTEFIVLAFILKQNTTLISLDVRNNYSGSEGAYALGYAVYQSKTLEKFSAIPILNYRNGIGNTMPAGNSCCGDSEGIAIGLMLKKNNTLTEVSCVENFFSDITAVEIAEGLKSNNTLTKLVLSYNKIKDKGCQALGKTFEDNDIITSLELLENEIGDAGAEALGTMVNSNTTLTRLSVGGNRFRLKGMKALSEGLKNNNSIEILGLSKLGICSIGAKHLADGLMGATALTEVWMQENQIGDEGAKSISEMLINNSSIVRLEIFQNEIGDKGTIAIGKALEKNNTLQEIGLGKNSITDPGACAIAKALKSNKALQRLWLNDNQIGDKGAIEIGNALKKNTTLKKLIIRNNEIRNDGAASIGDGLKNNSSLKTLSLYNTHVGDIGCKHIADGLKENTSLTKILLGSSTGGNEIGCKGAIALGDALKQNKTLTQLSLSNNKIGDVGAKGLADGLQNNKTLTKLDLVANPNIKKTGKDALNVILDSSASLRDLRLDR